MTRYHELTAATNDTAFNVNPQDLSLHRVGALAFAVILLLLSSSFLRDCIRLADRDQRELFMTFSKVFSRSVSFKVLDIEA